MILNQISKPQYCDAQKLQFRFLTLISVEIYSIFTEEMLQVATIWNLQLQKPKVD